MLERWCTANPIPDQPKNYDNGDCHREDVTEIGHSEDDVPETALIADDGDNAGGDRRADDHAGQEDADDDLPTEHAGLIYFLGQFGGVDRYFEAALLVLVQPLDRRLS